MPWPSQGRLSRAHTTGQGGSVMLTLTYIQHRGCERESTKGQRSNSLTRPKPIHMASQAVQSPSEVSSSDHGDTQHH